MYMYTVLAIYSCIIVLIFMLLGVRNEFFNQLHKFLAHLTDAQHKTVGHTVLYVPDEGSLMTDPESYKNKDFVQRMESKTLCIIICVKCAGYFIEKN